MKQVVQHVIDKIKNTELHTDPYPYLYIENIFPDEFYEQITKNFIDEKFKGYSPLSKQYSSRLVCDLGYGENGNGGNSSMTHKFQGCSNEQREFWVSWREYFIDSNKIPLAFLDKYSEFLSHNIRELADKGFMNARLSLDKKGYFIGSHRDKRNKIFSALFYLPESVTDEVALDWGTAIMSPRQDMEHTDEHHSFDKFEVKDTALCLPNSMFSWAVTQNSYHGVTPITFDNRKSIAYFLKTRDMKNHILYGEPGFK